MHKIKQTIFLNLAEVKEYELSILMINNPIYITEEDNFLVPRFGSMLYYELSNSKSEIVSLRDLIARNTITIENKKGPPPPPSRTRGKKIF